MKRINGKLLAASLGSPTQNTTPPSFRGYQVELSFDVDIVSQTDPNQTYRISQTSDFLCGDDGVFILEFEETLEFADGVARIIVSAPNGARLSDQTYPLGDLDVSTGPAGSEDLTGSNRNNRPARYNHPRPWKPRASRCNTRPNHPILRTILG